METEGAGGHLPSGLVAAGSDATGGRGAVATPHVLATEAGLDALRAGGSAVDAALAAAAMLAVVYPHQCSIGGDAFALLASPDGEVLAINGSGRTPNDLDVVAVRRSHDSMPVTGPLSVTVPGVLAAWSRLDRLGGRLGLASALKPAIALARDGARVSRSLRLALELDRVPLAAVPGIRDVFFDGDAPLPEDAPFRQAALARTLETLARHGVGAFYEGELGKRFVAGMRDLGSPLRAADLAAHETSESPPLTGRYRAWEILTTPPNTQGFVLLEILAALDGVVDALDPTGHDRVALARLFRLTAADRDTYLADGETPLETLLGAVHIASLRTAMRRPALSVPPARSTPLGRDTVAICAADESGWRVVLIQSVFHSFGARLMEPETGIIVQNRGAAFSLEPDVPYRLAPGRRPPHTLMPVMVRMGGRVAWLSGAMGGKAQPQIQAELLGRLLDLGQSPAEAVSAARWVVGGLDIGSAEDVVRLEGRLDDLREGFEWGGLQTARLADYDEEVGQAQVIAIQQDGFVAAADPRSDGAAAAW